MVVFLTSIWDWIEWEAIRFHIYFPPQAVRDGSQIISPVGATASISLYSQLPNLQEGCLQAPAVSGVDNGALIYSQAPLCFSAWGLLPSRDHSQTHRKQLYLHHYWCFSLQYYTHRQSKQPIRKKTKLNEELSLRKIGVPQLMSPPK